jgi:hypothetical protein
MLVMSADALVGDIAAPVSTSISATLSGQDRVLLAT